MRSKSFTAFLLILFMLLLICPLVGCAPGSVAGNLLSGTDPALNTYRDGLHAVDEPLYTQHSTLISDAVNVGQVFDAASTKGEVVPPDVAEAITRARRSPNEQNIVATEIAKARALYQQGAASTQPSN